MPKTERVLKFRAWDDTNKKWAYEGFHLFGEVMVFDLLRLYKLEDACKSLSFQQFTGYKDFNNKDVYEGDIIKSINGQIELAVVEFNNAAFWLKSYDPMYGEHHEEIYHWPANRIALEVVGNINENPELLPKIISV